MAKIFEWQDAIKTKPRKGESNEVLLWIHDATVDVSYCFSELCYWDGEDWIIGTDPMDARVVSDYIVVKWCYVPKARMGLYTKL